MSALKVLAIAWDIACALVEGILDLAFSLVPALLIVLWFYCLAVLLS